MTSKICFIDDDEHFEIPLFVKTFGEEFDLITATNFGECCRRIDERGNWTPDLFVLDLYFPSGLADTQAVRLLVSQPSENPNDQGEIRQAYMNYLAAKSRLEVVLAAWKQGPEGGIRLAAQIHARYPDVPIVFYSRKATAEDVLRCMAQDGVLDVISKPTGRDDSDTEDKTREMKDGLSSKFREMMNPAVAQQRAAVQQAVNLVLEGIRFFQGYKITIHT